jgi:hypothetical protein
MDREAMKIDHAIQKVWHERTTKIPYLNFPSTWDVKIIPPTSGATIRFLVRKHPIGWTSPSKYSVSIYLDFDHALGYFGAKLDEPEPYWEIYPNRDGDTARYALNDVDALLGGIALALEKDNA